MDTTDILIAGGGIAGLSAAARLSADGWSVAVVDPAPAIPEHPTCRDLRTTAFLQPAIRTLTIAGAWEAMSAGAAPLRVMRLVDAGGIERTPRETADFTPGRTGLDAFGMNVANAPARAALSDVLSRRANVRLMQGRAVTGYVSRRDHALLRLSDGTSIAARLAVAADGRDSGLRAAAGLGHKRWDYGQQALVFSVSHGAPHDGVSTEIHRTGGPLTFVPMPDVDDKPSSSVVWMMPGPRAQRLAALDNAALEAELATETMGLFGPVRIIGSRATWPIISQIALGLTAHRLALIAEAAHVMPPIGAQGLNTSLDDIETLAGLIAGQPDPGAEALLARYQTRQMPKVMAKIAGIDLLNRAARTEVQPLRDLRRAGLSALSRIGPLRELAIRAGLGL